MNEESTRANERAAEVREGQPCARFTFEELTEYHRRQMDDEAAEAVREHLAVCPECTGVVLSLAAFDAGAEDPVSVAEAREANLLSQTIIAQEKARKWRAVASVAAGVVLAGIGLVVIRGFSGSERSVATSPGVSALGTANLAIASLSPREDDALRGTVRTIELSAEAGFFALLLAVVEQPSQDDFRVEIRDAQGAMVVVLNDLRPTTTGRFQLAVPAEPFEPGAHVVHLIGGQGTQERRLGIYDLEVVRHGPRAGPVPTDVEPLPSP